MHINANRLHMGSNKERLFCAESQRESRAAIDAVLVATDFAARRCDIPFSIRRQAGASSMLVPRRKMCRCLFVGRQHFENREMMAACRPRLD